MKKRVRGTIGFLAVTLCLVFVTAFCIAMTVRSQVKIEETAMENYYHEKEKELLNHTRDFLQQEGFTNSGVTLTRVVDESGNREYTITIHHRNINKMPEQERDILKEKLQALAFLEENCSFCHTFLVNE